MKTKILITGATSGIGRALAFKLATQDNVLILSGRNPSKLNDLCKKIQSLCEVHSVIADLSQDGHIQDLSCKISDVSVIINSAAEFGPTQSLLDVSKTAIETALKVNVLVPIVLSQSALPEMIRNNYGRIINIGSTGGLGAYPLRTPYCVSKSALVSFTKTFNAEISAGQHNNVRSFCVCPGPVEGDRLEKQIKDRASYTNQDIELMREKFTSILGRVLSIDEVVERIVSLIATDVQSDEIVTFQ